MIKEILILLWILIIPLVITIRRLCRTYTTILPQQEQIISKEKKSELIEIIVRICCLVLIMPFLFIIGEIREQLPVVFSVSDMLRGLLAGEIIIVDLAMFVFYFDLEKDKQKAGYAFLFVVINFWTSALWAIRGELSLTVLWISVIAYFAFGLERIVSYLEKGKS